MTKQKYLSRKKTSKQSISISPDLRTKIIQYLNKYHKKYPIDERYSSISAFYTYIMKKAMKIFEMGKTLDDFENFADQEIVNFYGPFTFKALKPLYEMITEPNRYTSHKFEEVIGFLLNMKEFVSKPLREKDINNFKVLLKRFEVFFAKNKIASKLSFEPLTHKNTDHLGVRISAISEYTNLSYESSKIYAAIFAILGMRVVDFKHTPKDNYFRIDALPTDLLFKDELLITQRKELYKYNVSIITNYNRILNDEPYYLWMKMAEDKSLLLNFHNDSFNTKWFKCILSDIHKFSTGNTFLLNLLKYFQALHWITIINENDLLFEFVLSNSKNYKNLKHSILDYLSNYSKIIKMDNRYILNPIIL